MNIADPTPIARSPADLVADDSLTGLRRAFHSLEAFQLSPAHRSLKARLSGDLRKAVPTPQCKAASQRDPSADDREDGDRIG